MLSEDGQGSWSRTGSAIIMLPYADIVLATRSIPERTEELAFVLAALYGVNQLNALGQWLAAGRAQPRDPTS